MPNDPVPGGRSAPYVRSTLWLQPVQDGPVTRRTPPPDDPAAAGLLRDALRLCSYTVESVRGALGTEDAAGYGPGVGEILGLEGRLSSGPLGTLVRLFLLNQAVDPGVADGALAPLGLRRALQARILVRIADGVTGAVRILPDEELGPVAIDSLPEGSAPDEVMAIAASSATLAGLTVRLPVSRAVDIGTGCGYQSLLLARHCARVVATDLNPRAVAFTRFNAALGGVTNLETRTGDLFAAVTGETFDAVVCNPPFVISPQNELMFRDGGRPADRMSRDAVRGAAAHLSEGGFASIIVHWAHPEDDWERAVGSWVTGCGCDALILHLATHHPADYAQSWNGRPVRSPQETTRRVTEWLDYYDRLGIERISYGVVVLRRRSGDNWIRSEHVPAPIAGQASRQLLALFAAGNLLRSLKSPMELLSRRLVLNPRHRLDQRLRAGPDGWQVSRAMLVSDEPLRFGVDLDPGLVEVIGHLGGGRTLPEVLTGRDAAGMLPGITRLVETGLLIAEVPSTP